MARKTDGEKIDQLQLVVATLSERLDNLSEDLKDLKRSLEEDSRRRWALLPPIVSALVSGLLAALIAYFIARR